MLCQIRKKDRLHSAKKYRKWSKGNENKTGNGLYRYRIRRFISIIIVCAFSFSHSHLIFNLYFVGSDAWVYCEFIKNELTNQHNYNMRLEYVKMIYIMLFMIITVSKMTILFKYTLFTMVYLWISDYYW